MKMLVSVLNTWQPFEYTDTGSGVVSPESPGSHSFNAIQSLLYRKLATSESP